MNQNPNPNFIKDLKNIFLKLYYYYHFDFYKIYKILENQNLIYYPFDLKKIYETLKEVYNQIELKNNKENTYELEKIKSKVKFFWEDDFLDYLILNDYPVGILFYEGNYELLKKNYKKIAIVGSRKPENKTIKFINSFFEKYSDLLKNFVIVSGLAVGIDSLVHKYSIDNNINTIAVLGNGIFYYYPSVNKELQIKISKKGLLLSEYPDNISPKKYYFPYRNRIISLISDIVIVFQASEKSGSIITGKYALEFGKELIVPFLDFNYSFEGSKNLINSGGKLVSSIDDLAQNIIKSIDYN
ncbi:MAG: DNA-processing protein DprA, partial [bacterium]